MPVAADIRAVVTNVLIEVLVIERGHITPAAALLRDLGADSLDLLEITYQLEHKFGFEIPRGDLFPDSILRIGPERVQDGKLTDKGMAEIRLLLPYLDLGAFQNDMRLNDVSDLLTVDLLIEYVTWRLERCSGLLAS
jgi:acyl carrier protein